MCFEVKAFSSALFFSTRFGPKLRFSVGRVPWFATRNVCRIVWNILTAWGKNYAWVFIRLPVAKPNKVLSSVYIEKRQHCGRIGKRELPVSSLLQWDDYLTFGERGIVISDNYKKAWNYWNYSVGLCIAQLAGLCTPIWGSCSSQSCQIFQSSTYGCGSLVAVVAWNYRLDR